MYNYIYIFSEMMVRTKMLVFLALMTMAAGRPGPSGASNEEGMESWAAQPMAQAGDRAPCYPPQSMACILSGRGKEQERSGAAEAGDRKPGEVNIGIEN